MFTIHLAIPLKVEFSSMVWPLQRFFRSAVIGERWWHENDVRSVAGSRRALHLSR